MFIYMLLFIIVNMYVLFIITLDIVHTASSTCMPNMTSQCVLTLGNPTDLIFNIFIEKGVDSYLGKDFYLSKI